MKTTTFLAIAAVGKLAAAHATFQEMLVNGKSQGSTGVRGTSNQNNPIYSTADELASDMIICKGGSSVAGSVSVASGDKLTLQWHHNNPMSAGDGDEPIASSHKGPVIVWVAKAETEGKGNAWVKIQENGLSGGTWGVDTFRSNAGKIDVTVPDLAAGDYLIRSEIIALHEADRAGKAQFYNGCGQIKVTSSGTKSITSGVAMQSVYKTDDAGVLFNIYGGATTYPVPGPAVNAGLGAGAASPTKAATSAAAASSTKAAATSTKAATTSAVAPKPTSTKAVATSAAAKPTTLATVVKTTTAAGYATPTKAATGSVAKWGQCGGIGYTGATGCVSGSTCKVQNPYYSQCL